MLKPIDIARIPRQERSVAMAAALCQRASIPFARTNPRAYLEAFPADLRPFIEFPDHGSPDSDQAVIASYRYLPKPLPIPVEFRGTTINWLIAAAKIRQGEWFVEIVPSSEPRSLLLVAYLFGSDAQITVWIVLGDDNSADEKYNQYNSLLAALGCATAGGIPSIIVAMAEISFRSNTIIPAIAARWATYAAALDDYPTHKLKRINYIGRHGASILLELALADGRTLYSAASFWDSEAVPVQPLKDDTAKRLLWVMSNGLGAHVRWKKIPNRGQDDV